MNAAAIDTVLGGAPDLATVAPLPHTALVQPILNRFVVRTVEFVNRFATVCDSRLARCAETLDRLEVTLAVLEAKLSSVPELEHVTAADFVPRSEADERLVASVLASSKATAASSIPNAAAAAAAANTPPPPPPSSQFQPQSQPLQPTKEEEEHEQQQVPQQVAAPVVTFGEDEPAAAAPEPPKGIPVSKDPRFAKYFKLLKIGVHPAQIKQKMQAEGVDPRLLDTPNAIVPPAPEDPNEEDDDMDMGDEE